MSKIDIERWQKNAEEDYIKTPISVLRYITELEKATEAQKQPFQIDKGDTETLQAKLRNALSPIYGLAEMIINSEGSSELISMCVEQAKVAIKNTERIDSLLIAMEQKQPAMSLDTVSKQILLERYIKQEPKMFGNVPEKCYPVTAVLDMLDAYANQFREAQKWEGKVKERIIEIDNAIPLYEDGHPILGSMKAEKYFLQSLLPEAP